MERFLMSILYSTNQITQSYSTVALESTPRQRSEALVVFGRLVSERLLKPSERRSPLHLITRLIQNIAHQLCTVINEPELHVRPLSHMKRQGAILVLNSARGVSVSKKLDSFIVELLSNRIEQERLAIVVHRTEIGPMVYCTVRVR